MGMDELKERAHEDLARAVVERVIEKTDVGPA
jgi:hypothetical protein